MSISDEGARQIANLQTDVRLTRIELARVDQTREQVAQRLKVAEAKLARQFLYNRHDELRRELAAIEAELAGFSLKSFNDNQEGHD